MKLNRNGFTCWPLKTCRPVEIVEYHGDKRCWVRMSVEDVAAVIAECASLNIELHMRDSQTFEMRIGYVSRRPYKQEDYKDFLGTRRIDRHVLQGRSRKSFKPVVRKTQWVMYGHGKRAPFVGHQYEEFGTLKEAVAAARAEIQTYKIEVVELGMNYSLRNNRHYSSSSGSTQAEVYADGAVIVYHGRKAHNLTRTGDNGVMQRGVYMRGSGKTKATSFGARRAWAGGRRQKYFVSVKPEDLK